MVVYLLLGDDEERKTRGVERLRKGRATEAYDAAETSPETIISACNSYSLFGEGPFVLLRNLDAWNAAQKAKVVDYLQDPSPEADLVMLGAKLGGREKLLAAVKKEGEVHDFKQPTGKALAKWTIGYAKRKVLELPGGGGGELGTRCSDEKPRLSRGVENPPLSPGGTATLEDVQ